MGRRRTRRYNDARQYDLCLERLAGYEDTNDADRLCMDPAMRQIVGGRAKERTAASTSQMARFETEILTRGKNLQVLMDLPAYGLTACNSASRSTGWTRARSRG